MNQKFQTFKKSISGKKVAVIGIGISNTPLIKFLIKLGANVTAFDKKSKGQLEEVYDELEALGVSFSLGDHYLSNISHEIIFKTPGMRYDIPELLEAREKGSTVTSEMEVFFELCPAPIIAVTGSDGKTTTTTLIHKILKQEGYHCWLGGNIGTPLLSEIENIKENHKVVLELSSFQLHTMRTSPDVAVITNITPNHLDVHKSMEEYIDAKKNIFLHQSKSGKLVINFDNAITRDFEKEAVGAVVMFSRQNGLERGVFIQDQSICVNMDGSTHKAMDVADIILPGMHNVENYMAATGAVWGLAGAESIKKVAGTFTGVEHRIELVRELNGIKFYNSSIDSSPNRTMATLNTFNQKVILIAGGKDKNIPYDEIGEALVNNVKCLILIGPTGSKIKKALEDEVQRSGKGKDIPVFICSTYEQVVKTAYSNAVSGDIILLSPASTSFDMFKNFEERGKVYKGIVKGL
ncbi:UDP-N-acetylmuramoyl-L-alanine--D-glutamate ligase [Petroclostridium sp. X23]|uniref:UDP-N-acetylmuramoyl-L-alanine--D-glutamate ligase n=1 Tax=Petroclostridium sp. X23 TaxID=3045146 RepID=UPI0024AC9BA4|nr:UDP-N-acetylmuramoyl-L-alanine--D-glutamate ligase [Petroclostridium sp. X23]WHH59491.1 UDP-N-acetylmuramoyl-L-alanine--D-glutamate ligase [Petroclostridium sp. X23]